VESEGNRFEFLEMDVDNGVVFVSFLNEKSSLFDSIHIGKWSSNGQWSELVLGRFDKKEKGLKNYNVTTLVNGDLVVASDDSFHVIDTATLSLDTSVAFASKRNYYYSYQAGDSLYLFGNSNTDHPIITTVNTSLLVVEKDSIYNQRGHFNLAVAGDANKVFVAGAMDYKTVVKYLDLKADTLVWEREITGGRYDENYPYAMDVSQSKGYVVLGGMSNYQNTPYFDLYMSAYSLDGDSLFQDFRIDPVYGKSSINSIIISDYDSSAWLCGAHNTATNKYRGALYNIRLEGSIDTTTGTTDIVSFDYMSNIVVYPNPTSSSISLRGLDGMFTFSILNTVGSRVQSGSNSGNNPILLTNLASGVYVMELSQNGKRYFVRLIKN
jgi:hypothetical protein